MDTTKKKMAAIFRKGNNFFDFLFASLDDETVKVRGQLIKGRTFPS